MLINQSSGVERMGLLNRDRHVDEDRVVTDDEIVDRPADRHRRARGVVGHSSHSPAWRWPGSSSGSRRTSISVRRASSGRSWASWLALGGARVLSAARRVDEVGVYRDLLRGPPVRLAPGAGRDRLDSPDHSAHRWVAAEPLRELERRHRPPRVRRDLGFVPAALALAFGVVTSFIFDTTGPRERHVERTETFRDEDVTLPARRQCYDRRADRPSDDGR